MKVKIPPKQCSNCGYVDSETFQRTSGMSGIRCLRCGHESIDKNPLEDGNYTWSSGGTAIDKF